MPCCAVPLQEDEAHDFITPPENITANHIYTNVYRRALTSGLQLEEAQDRARKATAHFRTSGQVRQAWVGTFRTAKTAA